MPSKFNRQRHAVGAWSNPHRRIEAAQLPAQVRVWLQDKLIARGRFVQLYLPVSSATPGVVACTCVKDTTASADRACLTCHGTKYAPGYTRFLSTQQFWCSAEHAAFTLTDVSVLTTKKAHTLALDTGALTGVIETPEKDFDNADVSDWELKLEAYRRATGSTFALEFSVDAGMNWTPVVLTESVGHGFTATIPGAQLQGVGQVRFRLTMTRVSADDLTPAFEIIRIRHVRHADQNRRLQRSRRRDFQHGHLLILRPWVIEQDGLEPGRGRLIEHTGDRTWTAPLDYFDTTLTPDTPPCRVQAHEGPHPFYVYTSGIQADTRYVITKVNYNEQLGIFTHQFFDDRRAQENEHYGLVW